MLERLAALLRRRTPPRAPLPVPDARLAMGTLLVRVAMADRAYLFEEVAQIDRILAEAHGLDPVQAARMRADCERLAFAVEDDGDLARIVREAVDYDHRREKVAALWRVATADGISDEREAALVELVEERLGVARADSEAARAAAAIP